MPCLSTLIPVSLEANQPKHAIEGVVPNRQGRRKGLDNLGVQRAFIGFGRDGQSGKSLGSIAPEMQGHHAWTNC
jgi:hypothetical protein